MEIDLTYLKSTYEEGEHRGDLVQYIRHGQRLFLANDGKPINFLDGSAIGSTLDLVYTELYACTRQLADGVTATVGLQALDDKQRDRIVERWLDFYAVPDSSVRYGFLNTSRR